MTPEEAIETRIKAVATADSGVGGLLNNGSAAYLRGGMLSLGDPAYWPNQNNGYPFVVLEPILQNLSPGFVTGTTNYCYSGVIRFHIFEDRDSGHGLTRLRDIDGRLIVVFNDASLATVADSDILVTWSFCRPRLVGPLQSVGVGGKQLHYVRSFGITTSAVPTV